MSSTESEKTLIDQDRKLDDSSPTRAVPRRLRESLALAKIGRAVSESEKLEVVYQQIATSVRELVPAYRVILALVAPETGELHGEFTSGAAGEAPRACAGDLSRQRDILEEVRASGNALRFDDIPSVPDGCSDVENAVHQGTRSGIYAPLVVRGSVIGVLGADDGEPGTYSDADLDLLERIATQIAGSVASAQLHRTMERDTKERELVAEIGRAASSTLDMAEALDRVFEKLDDLLPADRVSISMRSESTGSLDFAYTSGVTVPSLPGQTAPRPSANGLPALVFNTGTSRIINDLSEVLDEAPGVIRALEAGLNSDILVPLFSGDETIGVFAVNALDLHAYTMHDLNLVERLAPHLAGAIINARLHDEVNTRAREEAMLAEVGLVVTSSPEFGDVVDSLAELISGVIPFDRFAIASIDEVTGGASTRFFSGVPVEGFMPGDSHFVPASSLEAVRKTGNVEFIDSGDPDDVDSASTERHALAAGLRSGMSANLISRGLLVGNLSVRSKDPDAYGPRDLELLRRVSVQIAGAFANSELHQQLERRAREETLLAEVSRAVSSSPEFGDVFDRVAELISRSIDFDRFVLTGIDLGTQLAYTRFVSGAVIEGFAPGEVTRLSDELIDSGYFDTRGSVFETTELEDQIGYGGEKLAGMAGLQSGVGVNLRSQGLVVGNLSLRSNGSGAYGTEDLDLLVRIGDQLAGAFANWELLMEVERRAREDSVLANIGRKISTLFDPDTVLELIMDDLREILNVDRSVISLVNRDTDLLEFRFVSGKPLGSDDSAGKRDSLPNGISERVVSTGAPVVISDIPAFIDRIPGVDELQHAGFRSAISVPLIWNEVAIGAFGFASEQFESYDDQTVEFIRRVSGLLTGWMMNAQLRNRLERQAQVNAVLAAVGRDAGSSLNLKFSLQSLVDRLKELMPVDRLTLAVNDTGSDGLRIVFATGVGYDGMTSSDESSLTSNGLTAQVFNSREPLRSNDIYELIATYPGARNIHEAGLNSTIVVPLLWERETVGILGVAALDTDAYQPDDLEVIERAAQLLAGTVVNAELHERVEQRAKEEAVLSHIGRVVNSSVSLGDVYESFAVLAAQLVPADRIVITTVGEHEYFVERYIGGSAIPGREPGTRIPLKGSLTELCVSGNATVNWSKSAFPDDYWDEYPALQPVLDSGIRAILAIPLSVQNVKFGTLIFTNFEDRAYSEHEASLGESVADQIAGGISGASLREDASRRAIEESMLSDVYQVLNSSLDLTDVFPGFVEKLALLLPTDKVVVNVIDRETDEWVDQREWHADQLAESQLLRGPLSGSATEAVARTREPLVLGVSGAGYPSAQEFPGMVPSFEAGIQSTIVVPMTSDSDVFGALFIHSTEPEAYTEDQVRLAERVGLMLASAVSNALLLKESEMSSRERGIVADIAGMLGSTLDLTEIYAGVVEKIRELLPYDRLSLVRLNVEAGSISSLYSVGVAVPEWLPGVYRPLKGTVFEELTKTRAGLRKSRAPDDGFIESFPGHAPLAKVMDVRSLIAAPLMHQGEAIGALILSSRTPNAYSRSDLELAERVSSQITGAVVNADLFARTEREAYERTLLAKLGQMAGSTLDVQGLYENAATPLNRLIPYDRLSIATFDTEANVWQTAFVAGGALEAAEPGENQSTGSETSKYIAETRQALLLRHPGDHGGRFINNRGFKAGMKSLILVPVVWADQVIAVMALHSQTEYAYGNHELRIAEQAASQIAGAITNARLHARVNQQAREQALLARIGRVISSASSPDNVFDQFMELVLKLIPADRAEITSSGRDGKVVVHCTTLSGPAIPGRRDGDVLPLDGSWTEHIMEGG